MSAPVAQQTSVLSSMPIGVSGQWADLQSDEFGETESLINDEASASLVFGTLQQKDSATTCKQVTGTSNVFGGILLFERVYDFPSERDDFGPLPGLPVELAVKGRLLVFCETAATAETDTVHVRKSSENRASNLFLGGFRNAGVSGATIAFDRSALRFKSTIGSSGIVEIEINMPQGTLSTPTAD